MFLMPTSIRGRIAAGYVLGFVFLALVASVLFVSLGAIEAEVGFSFGISRFLDATLEMRRYEKNYVLYGTEEDLSAATRYADAASALASSGALDRGAGRSWLGRLDAARIDPAPDDASAERASRLLEEYRALLRDAADERRRGDPSDLMALDAAIRDVGRRITDIAERLSTAEERRVQRILRTGRTTLVVLVVVFLIGTAFIARLVLLTAIRPLRELEREMRKIAGGEYELLPEGPGKDERITMYRAFNRMIREIFEHRQEAFEAERLASLGTMLAGIAHELNNPLSNISTSAEILREEHERAGPEARRELIDQIVSQTDRATDLIRTVLDFTREPRGDRRATNLLSAVRGSAILVRGQKPAHVALEIDVPGDLEVLADKAKLEQTFINLLTNAMQSMKDPGREGRVAVSARADGDAVEIAVADTGAGIPRHLLDRVFDPFFTTKDVGEGTGLGLYLTHQFVEQHGGTIRVESEVGAGTTVVLRLPRATPAGRGATPAAAGERGEA